MATRMKTIKLTETQAIIVRSHAQKADIGGLSNIGKRDERQAEWQLTGMACEAAAWIAFNERGFLGWDVQRCHRNSMPNEGDNGEDLPGGIDVKGSLRRSERKQPQDYHLWVRPREYKENSKYVLAIAEPDFMVVHLVGWSFGRDMQYDSEHGRWEAGNLNPIAQLLLGEWD